MGFDLDFSKPALKEGDVGDHGSVFGLREGAGNLSESLVQTRTEYLVFKAL